jgi:hypothetical protein
MVLEIRMPIKVVAKDYRVSKEMNEGGVMKVEGENQMWLH